MINEQINYMVEKYHIDTNDESIYVALQEYDRLICNAIAETISGTRVKVVKEGKYEKHHILPNCIENNKVTALLTLDEHYDAHKLLKTIFMNDEKLANVFYQMETNHWTSHGDNRAAFVEKRRKIAQSEKIISPEDIALSKRVARTISRIFPYTSKWEIKKIYCDDNWKPLAKQPVL